MDHSTAYNLAVGKYVSIGDGTYSNMNLTLIDDWKITIGKNVLIGPNVTLCTTGHPIDPEHRGDGMYSFSQSPLVIMYGWEPMLSFFRM